MQSQPDVSPSQKGLTRFASSKLLKIETAFWSRTKSKRRHSARFHLDPEIGGGERDRTDDLLLAKQALSQLSYTPDRNRWWVWLDSNQRPPPYQDGALTD
jgi:hypothetical protein